MSEPFTRKFPRVRLQPAVSESFEDLEVHVVWPNLETTPVLDLSFKGLATRKPGLYAVQSGAVIPLKVVFGTMGQFEVQAKVVWLSPGSAGFEIDSLPAEGHLLLSRVMNPTLLGVGLRMVNKALFSPEQSFDYWFQGSTGIHVLIWLEPETKKIDRVSVDLNGENVEFSAGTKVKAPNDSQRQALLVLSQIDKDLVPVEEFVKSIGS